ncbi:EAL domain-containing protein [Hippea sp. KM1]|uniref:EAL domain-containing protein n=1 Tax=Hippea sp. KM1 TaxID=944481 RepID=UPI00046D2771|nr:EAL domain-containing protein [Hippea sp. KM1]
MQTASADINRLTTNAPTSKHSNSIGLWKNIVEILDFAFQPIVSIENGELLALEALLRNYQKAGFCSIPSVFDEAYKEGVLYKLDLLLRRKALSKFKKLNLNGVQLFYNLDYRILDMPDFSYGNTKKILKDAGFNKNHICFELSEVGGKHAWVNYLRVGRF